MLVGRTAHALRSGPACSQVILGHVCRRQLGASTKVITNKTSRVRLRHSFAFLFSHLSVTPSSCLYPSLLGFGPPVRTSASQANRSIARRQRVTGLVSCMNHVHLRSKRFVAFPTCGHLTHDGGDDGDNSPHRLPMSTRHTSAARRESTWDAFRQAGHLAVNAWSS